MAQQTIFLGTNPNDGTGEPLRGGGAMINNNFTELYALQSQTINAGSVDYDFTGATNEQRIALADADAIVRGFSTIFIPAFMLPYDITLCPPSAGIQRVREGGTSDHYDVIAYGGGLQATHDALPANGGTIYVPPTATPFGTANTTPLVITKAGVVVQFTNAAFTYAGTGRAIQCAIGLAGIVLEGTGVSDVNSPTEGTSITITNTAADGIDVLENQCIIIRNISLIGPASGTGRGIRMTGNGFLLDNTQTMSFGSHGTEIDGDRGNSNSGVLMRARSYWNGGDGFHVAGGTRQDANLCTWINTDAQSNTGKQFNFSDCFTHVFSPIHAYPVADVTSVAFVNASSCVGSVYVEPFGAAAAAGVTFDATSKFNDLVLLNTRIVTDVGFGNQWVFRAADAGVGVAGRPNIQWFSGNVDDTINVVRRLSRANTLAELTREGILSKSGSARAGYALATDGSLNLIYDSANVGTKQFNIFCRTADASLDTANPVTQWESFTGFMAVRRINAKWGTALVAGHFALSGGWGSTAAISAVTGTDQAWQLTITANGTGIGANPTLTLTFADGTWGANSPICISKMQGGTGTITPLGDAPTATTNVITFIGTPIAGSTYTISSIAMGR